MNINTIGQRLQQDLADPKRRRRLLKLVVIAVAALGLLTFLSQYSLVRITFLASGTAGTGDPQVFTYDAATGRQSKVMSLGGLYFVPASTVQLAVRTDTSEAMVGANGLSAFGYRSLEVELQKPESARLLSSGGESCPVINGSGVYSSACANPTAFVKHELGRGGIPRQTKTVDLNGQYISSQYKDGILAWYGEWGGSQSAINYIVPSRGVAGSVITPSDLKRSDNFIQLITDTTDANNTGFVVYDYNNGIAYYYSDFSANVKPKTSKRQHQVSISGYDSSCTLVATTFSCYHGTANRDSHDHSDADDSQPVPDPGDAKGVVEVTDFSAAAPTVTSYAGPDGFGMGNLYATSDGSLFGRSGYELVQLNLGSSSFSTALISSASQVAAGGRLFYYAQNNRIYAYDPAKGTSALKYYDANHNIEKLIAQGDRLLSLSYDRRDPVQLLNLYQIGAED